MLTTSRLYALTEFVRMDRSGDGQKALRLMSEAQITEWAANDIAQVLSDSCNFVDDWNSIAYRPGFIRVFGTRAAEREDVKMVLDEIEKNQTIEKYHSMSCDEYTTTGTTNWKKGTPNTTKLLNYRALEPQLLTFYVYAPLRLTTNNLNEGYTLGQLCLDKKFHLLQVNLLKFPQ